MDAIKEYVLIIIGGALSLLGALLANLLQYRMAQWQFRAEREKGRLAEVRRYLIACLELVDLVSIPTRIGPDEFGQADYEEWSKAVEEHIEKWKSLPVSGSARVLYVEDDEILDDLKQIDYLRVRFWVNYRMMIDQRQMLDLEKEVEKIKVIAKRVAARVDKLLG